MTCDLPPTQCLNWHVLGKIPGAKPTDNGRRITAPCPAHNSHRHGTLTVSVGDRGQRIVWHCHKGCDSLAVRAALTGLGIQPACLPVGRTRQVDLLDQINAITSGDESPAVKLLRITAATMGHRQLPGGTALERVADAAGVHRATAYRARSSPSTISSTAPGARTGASSQVAGVSESRILRPKSHSATSPSRNLRPLQGVQGRSAS